ncbi:MAG: hypothetical protein WAO71_00900 [Gallionella sp.]
MIPNDDLPATNTYSILSTIIFWVLWLLGLLWFLLFVFLVFFTVTEEAWIIATWNLLVVLAQGYVLLQTARYFLHKEQSVSELLLWATWTGIIMPMITSLGCAAIPMSEIHVAM